MAERITGHTELIGLMAYPIRHSSSPAMHNEAFAYLGLDYAYLAFEVDNSTLEDAIKGLRALKMVGSNVSMPNKTVVGQYLDKLSPAAELCGAVNTIVNENGVLTGHITDGIGFMQSLKDNDIDVIGKKMTIAGAGGAATAIEIQAALDGVKEISIFNIHDKFWENAEATVKKINERTNCKATLYDFACCISLLYLPLFWQHGRRHEKVTSPDGLFYRRRNHRHFEPRTEVLPFLLLSLLFPVPEPSFPAPEPLFPLPADGSGPHPCG